MNGKIALIKVMILKYAMSFNLWNLTLNVRFWKSYWKINQKQESNSSRINSLWLKFNVLFGLKIIPELDSDEIYYDATLGNV